MRSLSWLCYGCHRGKYLSNILYDSYYLAFYGKNFIDNDREGALAKDFVQLSSANPFTVLHSPSNSRSQLENTIDKGNNDQQRSIMTVKAPKALLSLSNDNRLLDNLTVTIAKIIPADDNFTPT
ncbi:MAG: hypothetical protein GY782_05705 [Gammaproteobacteria bacterium]|nr:hypothetical protein [Gammaproteobacteria bacterium]